MHCEVKELKSSATAIKNPVEVSSDFAQGNEILIDDSYRLQLTAAQQCVQ